MKTYQITERGLASFEAWLEIFLFDRVNRSVHSLRPAFDKIKIIKAFKEAYATEVPDDTEKPRGLKPTEIFFDELKGSGERELPIQFLKSQEDNIIKALNKICSILYGILNPDMPSDKYTYMDDLQKVLKTIEEEQHPKIDHKEQKTGWLLNIFQSYGIGNHAYTAPHEATLISGYQIKDIISHIEDVLKEIPLKALEECNEEVKK